MIGKERETIELNRLYDSGRAELDPYFIRRFARIESTGADPKCTERPLTVSEFIFRMPVFDTTPPGLGG